MFQAKNFDLFGIFSDDLAKNHITLYQGYVNNVNKLKDTIASINISSIEFAELNRRFGWEFNGMRLHELYFSNLKKGGSSIAPKIASLIIENFGSVENWEKNFKALGLMRGIGWVLLVKDQDRLYNLWINEHDVGLLANCKILLVMDMFEHAFMLDYGLKKTDYIDTVFRNLNWEEVESRLE